MNRILLGSGIGLVTGTAAVLLMLPMAFTDKKTALLAAFASRFAVGFLAVNVKLPVHPALAGAIVGLLVSIPDAIVTKAYAPIIVLGLVFGAVAGWAGGAWGA